MLGVCVCDCLKADQAEKSEWWCLYQCMGRIRQEFYRDSQRIQSAFETVALELAGNKWKPSQTFFQKHPSFRPVDSVARKQYLATDHMQFFKMTYSELLETYSSLVLEVLIFTLLLH